jgi:hypothetical protein
MKQLLNKLFADDGPRTGYATIVKRLSAAKYQMQDGAGRTVYAESTGYYPAGTEVITRDGTIVGPGSRAGKPKTYEV